MLFRNTFLVLVFFVHFVISNNKYTTSKQQYSTDIIQSQAADNEIPANNPTPSKEKICTDIDVRNYVSNFEVLRGCTVVEGYVQINLIDNSTAQDFANLSFPELKEITEYLSFYHVSGLKSIGKLPNNKNNNYVGAQDPKTENYTVCPRMSTPITYEQLRIFVFHKVLGIGKGLWPIDLFMNSLEFLSSVNF